ncbi:hypothetical protein GF386_04920 [Candidatus Pacearchaeota archaeon]|nr:hypothetical protein [Candidatus Pacearchaeota archaeon]MBD3283455.1 hypothetical protein [Candidatus Pacearchaeota archaeon]
MEKPYFMIFLMTLFFIVLISGFLYFIIKLDNYKIPENLVVEVIDGDTFVLGNMDRIRLICIDAPEKNQKGFQESKIFLETLILNKQVRLEKDISEKDRYGRLLRYVYVNTSNGEIFINKYMFEQGYAELTPIEPDISRCNEIKS